MKFDFRLCGFFYSFLESTLHLVCLFPFEIQYPNLKRIQTHRGVGSITVGKKLREARQSGFTFVVLFGKQCVDGKVELYDLGQQQQEGEGRRQEECRVLTLREAVDFLTKKRSQQTL